MTVPDFEAGADDPDALRALAVGDENPYHHLPVVAPALSAALPAALDRAVGKEAFADLPGSAYDAVVDYTSVADHTDAQREGLIEFVRSGGGYVGVHCATDFTTNMDGADPHPDLRDLVGGRFRHHPPMGTFDVHVFERVHPVGTGVGDFTVYDEPYDVAYDDDVTVIARMDHAENGDVPVAWAKPHGDGRVFYCSLGHDASALTAPPVARLYARGLRWAAGRLG